MSSNFAQDYFCRAKPKAKRASEIFNMVQLTAAQGVFESSAIAILTQMRRDRDADVPRVWVRRGHGDYPALVVDVLKI